MTKPQGLNPGDEKPTSKADKLAYSVIFSELTREERKMLLLMLLRQHEILELKEELEDKCKWIVHRLNSIRKHVYPGTAAESYVYSAFKEFMKYAFREPFDIVNVRSIQNVIEACSKAYDVKLVEYVPELRVEIEALKNSNNERLAELGEILEWMRFDIYLDDIDNVINDLRKQKYEKYFLFYDLADSKSILADVLTTELKNMAIKSGMSEAEAEKLIECLVGCR